jgi:hypothetical protein
MRQKKPGIFQFIGIFRNGRTIFSPYFDELKRFNYKTLYNPKSIELNRVLESPFIKLHPANLSSSLCTGTKTCSRVAFLIL